MNGSDAMVCEECMTKHPTEIDGREVNYCPFCGEELVGYSELGKLENDVYDESNCSL